MTEPTAVYEPASDTHTPKGTLLADAAREYELAAPTVTPEAMDHVARYRWPGNVRQLRAMCERWVIQCAGEPLRPEALPAELVGPARAVESPSTLFVDDTVPLATLTARLTNQLERAYLHKLLTRFGGHLQNTATAAGTKVKDNIAPTVDASRLDPVSRLPRKEL